MKESERRENQNWWIKWRWEFMRNNPRYPEAYQEALQLREMSPVSPDERNMGGYPYLQTDQGRKETALAKKFGLLGDCMIDPEKSFDDLIDGPDCMEKTYFFPTYWGHFMEYKLRGNHLILDIDLIKVNSFSALKKEVGKLLGQILDGTVSKIRLINDDEINNGQGIRKRSFYGAPNLRLSKDYQSLLDIGRQVEEIKQGPGRFSYKKAAKIIYPGLYKKNPDSIEKRIQNEFKDYQRLINGGYKEITYP